MTDPRSTPELLAEWSAVMRELRRRDVIRTNNNPTGDIAEALVHAHYGGERASFSQAGWDVRTPRGERLQVKAVRRTSSNKRNNLSPIRDREYDAIIVVLFDEDFRVTDALSLDREVAEDVGRWSTHVNGRILHLNPLLRDPRVERVDLTDAYARLHARPVESDADGRLGGRVAIGVTGDDTLAGGSVTTR